MKHLENLTIHRFRGLRDLHLESLGQINLLVGVNNSGKTSVLEAVSTYCNPLDPVVWLSIARRRNIKFTPGEQLESIEWLFPNSPEEKLDDSLTRETYISGDGRFPVTESRAIYREIYQESGINNTSSIIDYSRQPNSTINSIVRGAKIELKATIMQPNGNVKEVSEIFTIRDKNSFHSPRKDSMISLPVETVTPFTHAFEQLQTQLIPRRVFQEFKSRIIKLLQVIDPEIIDLDIVSLSANDWNIYLNHKQTGLSPSSAFGDGVRRLLFIALILAKVRGGVLLIDELETAIHTEALKPVFSWLVESCKQMNVQLFATTHSLETVDELLEASESADFAFYRLYPPDSKIKVIRHDRERLKRLRQDLGKEVRW